MAPKTRGGSTATRRSKRLNFSEILDANIVDDVGEDQVDISAPVNSSPVHDVSDPAASKEIEMDMEEDTEPLQPEKFFFSHNDYGKSCKLSTRCSIAKTLEALEKLDKTEMKWFRKHKQFKHIWHLARQEKNKLTGMWMLLLRTASTQKKRVRWFVVNGVPIRYSMREHALITGFDCHEYASGFNEDKVGSFDFVERVFGTKKVKVKDVRMKLESMDDKCGGDRLQVAVLYFLSTVIRGRRKFDTIYPFILKIVNDLKAVETFPWGRITFEDNLKEIDHAMNRFDSRVQDDYLFPGFIIPLEVLAFICIPELSKRFQEGVRGAKDGCPLMCKKKFKENGMPGFPLEYLNDALGTTDDIISILKPSAPEEALLLDIMERAEDEDSIDPIADAWNERLDVQKKKICWENLYKLDVAARGFGEINVPAIEVMGEPQHANVPAAEHISEPQLSEHWMIKKMKSMENDINELKMRLAIVERKMAADMRTGGDTMAAGRRAGGDLVDDDTMAGYEMAGDDEMRGDGHMVGDYDMMDGRHMVGDGTMAGDETVGVEMVSDEIVVGDETVGVEMAGDETVGVEMVSDENEIVVGDETVGVEMVGDETVGVEMAGDETVGVEIVVADETVGVEMVGDEIVAANETVGVEMVGDEIVAGDEKATKRKLKSSIHVTWPYTAEKKKEKKQKKDDKKEKK